MKGGYLHVNQIVNTSSRITELLKLYCPEVAFIVDKIHLVLQFFDASTIAFAVAIYLGFQSVCSFLRVTYSGINLSASKFLAFRE